VSKSKLGLSGQGKQHQAQQYLTLPQAKILQGGTEKSGTYMLYVNNLLNCSLI